MPVFRAAKYRRCWWSRLYLCSIMHRDKVVLSVPKKLLWEKYMKSFPDQKQLLGKVGREAALELEETRTKLTVKQVMKMLKYTGDPCLLSCTLCLLGDKALKSVSTEDSDPSKLKAARAQLPGHSHPAVVLRYAKSLRSDVSLKCS